MSLSSPYRQKQLRQLLQKLGLPSQVSVDWALLDLALTHPSMSAELNSERLEFLGDAVLKLAAAQFLYTIYPTASEGTMSAFRDVLVSDRTLAQVGNSYGLERYLAMDNAAAGDAAGQESRVANALEAVLAVLYMADPQLGLIRPWLEDHFRTMAIAIHQDPAQMNYKGALQELTQQRYQSLPTYRHRNPQRGAGQTFFVEVWVQGRCLGQGQGSSKKTAEQEAAQEAFLALQDQEPEGSEEHREQEGDRPTSDPQP